MSAVTVHATLVGVSAMIQNRDDLLLTNPECDYRGDKSKESRQECQERVWKEKAHYNKARQILVPASWIRKSLIASQRQSAFPIQPAGAKKSTDTLYQSFIAGILVNDSVVYTNGKGKEEVTPITENNLFPFKKMCRPSKTGGKVFVIRPMIQTPWVVPVDIIIQDPNIRPQNVFDCLAWCGQYNGFGDWRPATGGVYGVYTVKEVTDAKKAKGND